MTASLTGTPTSAARPASGRATPITRSGHADQPTRRARVQQTGRRSGAHGSIITGTPSVPAVRRVTTDGAPLVVEYGSEWHFAPFGRRFTNGVAGVDIAAFVVSVISAIGAAFGILYTRRSASSDRISAIADQSALKVAKEQLAIEQARRYKEMAERGEPALEGRMVVSPDDDGTGRARLEIQLMNAVELTSMGGDLPGRVSGQPLRRHPRDVREPQAVPRRRKHCDQDGFPRALAGSHRRRPRAVHAGGDGPRRLRQELGQPAGPGHVR